jgi:hypothetical protein
MTSFKPFLFPPINRNIAPLALRPLLIAGMVTPVVGGDGGVNISIVTDDPLGVLSVIDPYQGMQAGDRHRIYWEDVEIASKEVLPAEVDERLFIYLPIERMRPDWAEKVLYQLTRVGSNVPEDSVALRLRVKLDRPAGTDKDPHLPGHSELKKPKLPQDVIDNGVDAAWAARGVPVEIEHYPFRAARDTVSLKWGSVILRQQVTEDQANGTAPITLLVDQAAILAGGDSAALLVQYEVFDEVWNFSSDWSLSTTVVVDAGAWRLDAPIIKEAVNGDIDLIALAKKDVTVQIVVNAADFKLNDTVTMTWIGTPSTGKPMVHTEAVILSNVPTVLELKVPYADIRAIARGTGDASYVLTKANGDPPQSSKRTFARVIGEVSQLPAPSIVEVIGEVLDPTTAVANVQIPVYPGMDNGDVIDMVWLGTTASGTPSLHEVTHTVTAGEKGKVITLPVLNTHIAPLDRGTLDLYYRVSNDKYALFAVSESEHLLLKVEQIRAELPAPKVVEAPDGVLDPALVPDSATLLVDYLGTAPGDVLTYYWTGKPGDGSASDWVPITTPTAGKPITFRIDQTLIASNLNSLVKVRYTLKRATTGQFSYSATLDVIIGSLIGELPAPEVLEAPVQVLDPMDALNGATVRAMYESMQAIPPDIITLSWLGTPGAGTSQDLERPGNANGFVDFNVPASVVGANIGKQVEVSYDVSRTGQSSTSDLLELTVSSFLDPENQLPRPRITQADDASKVLNLSSFTGNAQVTVGTWPFSAARQRVWLRLEGKTSTGANYTIALQTGVELSAAQASNGLNETVLRSELEKLGHDSQLTVVCKVTFDGAADENSAIEFPRAAYTFKTFDDSIVPFIVSIKGSRGAEIPAGSSTVDTSVVLTGTAASNQQVEIFDGVTSQGTAPVNANGEWTLNVPGLTVASHSMKAKALYGVRPESPLWSFYVVADVAPTITSVKDSKGDVTQGGTTFDSSVTLAGKASLSQRVEIFDGTTSKGTATVNASGDWTLPLTGLTVASHSITAKALYGSEPVSAARTFTVAVATAPTITSVTDSKGQVANGGSTFDTSVTLAGKAAANQQVEIFDAAVSKGTVTVNASGDWTLPLTGLTVASHSITAKALYGSNPVSAARTFTVAVATAPTITSVKDSAGVEIPNGGSTFDTSVTLTGKAAANQQVEIFDAAVSKGTATVNASGDWTLPLTGLTVASHSITAKALYGSNPVSAARTFTVAVATAPTITSVKDSAGVEIPNGGSTRDTRVTITGTALINQQVQILDGASPLTTLTATGGNWTYTLPTTVKAYSIKARGLYGSNPESGVRSFTVQQATPPLVIDTSTLTLNGVMVRHGITPTTPPNGTFATRTASGGTPPYTYSGNNYSVEVNAASGLVISRRDGQSIVTVRDSAGQSLSYTVNVSGVSELDGWNGFNTYRMCQGNAASFGGHIPSMNEWNMLRACYGGAPGIPSNMGDGNRAAWSTDSAGGIYHHCIVPNTGAQSTQPDQFVIIGEKGGACGWVIIKR